MYLKQISFQSLFVPNPDTPSSEFREQRNQTYSFSGHWLMGTSLPVEVHDLGEFGIHAVGGHQAIQLRAGSRNANLRVDVQRAISTARRPDCGDTLSLVMDKVVRIH